LPWSLADGHRQDFLPELELNPLPPDYEPNTLSADLHLSDVIDETGAKYLSSHQKNPPTLKKKFITPRNKNQWSPSVGKKFLFETKKFGLPSTGCCLRPVAKGQGITCVLVLAELIHLLVHLLI